MYLPSIFKTSKQKTVCENRRVSENHTEHKVPMTDGQMCDNKTSNSALKLDYDFTSNLVFIFSFINS